MFKNRALSVQLIKTGEKSGTETSTITAADLEQIDSFIARNGQRLAIAIVGVYAAITAINTTSKIVVHKVQK